MASLSPEGGVGAGVGACLQVKAVPELRVSRLGIWRGRSALWVWAGSLVGVVEVAFDFFDAGGAPGFGPQGVEDRGDGARGREGQQRGTAGGGGQQGGGGPGPPPQVCRG